jgi:hypothetical protein
LLFLPLKQNTDLSSVTWFTRLIYSCITFAVASGDACPFVGHNAILRWEALQDAAAFTDEDGYEKYWSESHVSEDFDMSLRLQVAGYTLRYASYTGDGFKEGVSLTVYDELARWEKYAYGCNELLFHPLRFWLVRGPFTPLIRKFITSGIPLPKKLTIMAYIGTYYAIASAWLLTLVNYFITGWFTGHHDKYYLDSFAIYISIIVVFTALGNLALAVLRYRLSEQSLLWACKFSSSTPPSLALLTRDQTLKTSNGSRCSPSSSEASRCTYRRPSWRISSRSTWPGARRRKNSRRCASARKSCASSGASSTRFCTASPAPPSWCAATPSSRSSGGLTSCIASFRWR